MNLKISEENGFAPIAKVTLNTEDSIKIQYGSMIYHTDGINLEGNLQGGFFGSIAKSLVTKESIFISTVTTTVNGAEIAIGGNMYGSIKRLKNGETNWVLGDGAFLACDNSVSYKVTRQKANLSTTLFGGTGGFFNMLCEGHGDVLISSFGSIHEIHVTPDKPLHVDNGHALAWSSSLSYSLAVASGTIGFKTGEGFKVIFKGEGTVYISTKQISAIALSLSPYIPRTNN